MEAVVRTRTREILLLTTLGLCMGMALLTSALGLSLSLGAFLAGLLLARSQYSMSVISGHSALSRRLYEPFFHFRGHDA